MSSVDELLSELAPPLVPLLDRMDDAGRWLGISLTAVEERWDWVELRALRTARDGVVVEGRLGRPSKVSSIAMS